MKSKHLKIGIVIFSMLFVSAMSVDLPAEGTATANDSIAMVNGVSISSAELDMELERVKKQAQMKRRPINESNLPQIKAELLETLINRELLYQESVKKGIVVETGEIDTALDEIKTRFTNQQGFQQALADMNISEEAFKQQVHRGIAIQKLLDKEIYEKLTITDQESRSFYDNNPNFFNKPEQVRASHILIKVDPSADDAQKAEARKKIEEVQKKIETGEEFADLAKTYSQGPSSTQGGDLGYFDRKKMVKPFAEAAFQLQPGQVSPIVETRFGYHIIKVVDRKPETKLAYEEIKDRLTESLKQKKMQEAIAKYLEQLKSTAEIQRISS